MIKWNSRFAAIGVVLIAQSAALAWALYSYSLSAKEVDNLTNDLVKQKELRQVERTGRITAQQLNRAAIAKKISKDGYSFCPIGFVESPFPDRRGTPRQPSLVPAAVGKIRFDKRIIQYDHFGELAQFSHIWIIFVFHENTNTEKTQQNVNKNNPQRHVKQKAAKIKPPRLHGVKVGCLSTRSPHRPNDIGLSVCEIVSVGDDYIEVRCIDMVDGTPVLDVKPYIPYDLVPIATSDCTEIFSFPLPMAMTAEGKPLPRRCLEVPDWVVATDIPLLPVNFSEHALKIIHMAVDNAKLKHCRSVVDAIELITQVLRQDIRGVSQGRGIVQLLDEKTKNKGTEIIPKLSEVSDDSKVGFLGNEREQSSSFTCRLDCLELQFQTTSTGIIVDTVQLHR